MKKIFIIGLALMAILTSCATIFSGTKANVTVSTNTGERVDIKVDGNTYYNVSGPTVVKVKRTFKPSTIEAENEDSKGSVVVDKKFNAVTLGNIILGGIPGFIIDGASGAMAKPETNMYTIYMQAKDKPKKVDLKKEEPKKEEPQEMVQGLGNTGLEQTIIRWDIQSRPSGADIFWRVVSKTPDVKTSSEKYLQTTPYEATKGLDIKGLTYENSSNVRIILRCDKDGYLPQEKEYNVRMIYDQEEISAFFRLVKDE